jgi:hypothetical protein
VRRIKIIFYITIIVNANFSCNQNDRERQVAQKAREDSIRVATELATRLRIEKIQSLKDLLSQTESEQESLNNVLTTLKAELAVAKDKLTTIKQYQFLRTSSEREDQVRSQTLVIDQLEKDITVSLNDITQHQEVIRKTKFELKNYESNSND